MVFYPSVWEEGKMRLSDACGWPDETVRHTKFRVTHVSEPKLDI